MGEELKDIDVKEKDYKYDKRSLSKMLKEQEVLQKDFINALKKDDAKALHQLRQDYELKETQLRGFYKERMKEMENDAVSEISYSDVDKEYWAYKYISIATKNINNKIIYILVY